MLIREKDKQSLIKIFSGLEIPAEVWAYGSRVNGDAHEGSDLDLVIRSEDLSPLPLEVFSGLYEKIKDSTIPILVELRDWAMLPPGFHKNIEKRHEVLFDNIKIPASSIETSYFNDPAPVYKGKSEENDPLHNENEG